MTTRRARLRRWLKRLAIVSLCLLAPIGLALVSLMLPPVRSFVVRRALVAAQKTLPGQLQVGRAHWGWPLRIELDDVHWTHAGALLLSADRVRVDPQPSALWRRDLVIREIRVENLDADLPALTAAFEAAAEQDDSTQAQAPAGAKRIPFFRAGALPGLPSLHVPVIAIDVPRAALTAADTLRGFRLDARIDLLAGHAPVVDVVHLAGALPARGVELQPGHIRIDLQRGTVEAALDGQLEQSSFVLTTRGEEAERFDLQLRLPELEAAAELRGRWTRRGSIPVGLAFEASLRPPSPQTLGVAIPLDSLRAEVTGQLDFAAALRGHAIVQLHSMAEWFESLVVPLQLAPDGVSVENARVHLQGLSVEADASLREGALHSTIATTLDGTEWLRAVAGDSVALPDSIHVTARVEAEGPVSDPRMSLRVRGAVQHAGVALDALDIGARFAEGIRSAMTLDLALSAYSYTLDTRATVHLPLESQPLRATLRPVSIHARGATGNGDVGSQQQAQIEFDTETGRLRVERLHVIGDLGQLAIEGELVPESVGLLRLVASWPRPPVVPAWSPALAESLAAGWPRDFVPEIQLTAQIEKERTRVDGDLQFPGPEHLRALLPPAFDVSGMGALRARLSAEITETMSGDIDLGATSWLDTCRAEWSVHGTRTALESLQLRFEGLALDANAELEGDALAGRIEFGANQPALLQRLPTQERLRLSVTSAIDVAGSREAPHVQGEVDAALGLDSWSVPALEAVADIIVGRNADLSVRLPQGLTSSAVAFALDDFDLHFASRTTSELARKGHMSVRAVGPDIAWHQSMTLDLTDALRVQSDSLRLRLADRDLRALRPFQIEWVGAAQQLLLRDVQLEGSMGTVTADCQSTPDSLALAADVKLQFPAKPEWLNVPSGVWPERFLLDASGKSHDDVRVAAAIDGVSIAERANVRLELGLQPAPGGFEGHVALTAADTLLNVAAVLPLQFDQFPIRSHTLDDSLRLDAWWRGIPIPVPPNADGVHAFLEGEPREWQPRLRGRLHVHGTGARPALEMDATVGFPEGALDGHAVVIEVRGRGDERTLARLDLIGSGETFATARLDAPLRFRLAPFQMGVAEEELLLELRAESLDVVELNPLLPARTSASGVIDANVSVQGAVSDPSIAGQVRIDDFQMELPRRSFVRFDFAANLAGSRSAPEVEGKLLVSQARLRVPERDEDLHAAEGSPILWSEVADPDSVWRRAAPDTGGGSLQLPEGTKVEMRVDVPAGFWILGNDLGIELRGELDIGVRGRTPMVQGRLEGLQGWFVLMGRQFTLQRGICDFTGVNPLNPALDIEMRTQVGSTRIFVILTGDVEEPELTLRSEPEMSEGDIISTLVFGQPADQLGSGQGDFLAAQAAALAQSYSGAALQKVLGDQLGVDTVRFKSRAEGESSAGAGTSLEIGKYLTPEILVQYEIDLQTGRGLGVSLEYRLSQRVRLNTHFSQVDRSGIELNWTKDY
ncbi:MAG: translocation/assembly module TamB [Candidatus Latescibacterota bacterium]|nr:MAG: translocation/assembly module TamB [Candidatus Latescibacterota bacterium]